MGREKLGKVKIPSFVSFVEALRVCHNLSKKNVFFLTTKYLHCQEVLERNIVFKNIWVMFAYGKLKMTLKSSPTRCQFF